MKFNLEKDTQIFIDDFSYSDGELYRQGRKIGYYDKSSGYLRCRIDYKTYLVHRLIYLFHYGYLPKFVDHINRNKLDNRIENLRECKYKGNNTINSEIRIDNTSGYKGVTWHKPSNKWMSSVFYKGKRYHLGVFDDKDRAAIAYNKKAKELFGDFALMNKIGEVQ